MEKMNFGQIKKDLQADREYAENFKNNSYNEFFDSKFSKWQYHDSSLAEFGHSFAKTLPKSYVDILELEEIVPMKEYGNAFKAYIENTLQKNDKRVAIEFGGPGSVLFSQFSKGFFDKTLGVCLEDLRNTDDVQEDTENQHFIYVSDIVDTKNRDFNTYLHETLRVEKVDLIISRMMGPLNTLSKNPVILERVLQKWYSILKENGVLFAQFEYFIEHNPSEIVKYFHDNINPPEEKEIEALVKDWMMHIKKEFTDTIDVQLGRGVLRIQKKSGAPDQLPLYKDLIEE